MFRYILLVTIPINRIYKTTPKRSSTELRLFIAEYTNLFGFAIPDYSRYKRLYLPYKASDRSSSYRNYLKVNASSYDIFGLPSSTFRSILNEKRRLD